MAGRVEHSADGHQLTNADELAEDRPRKMRCCRQGRQCGGDQLSLLERHVRLLVDEPCDPARSRHSKPRRAILFPAPRGGYMDGERFREREWAPALRAAGTAADADDRDRAVPRTELVGDGEDLVDQRHTFATWAIESGVQLWYLARIMGTSVTQLEDTYARWLKRTDDQLRAAFDAYDAAFGHGMGIDAAESGYADERT